MVLIGLAKAYGSALGLSWLPFGILVDEGIVGFAALACRPGSRDHYWMYHFFIDQHSQGRGYGKRALRALIEQVKIARPECCAIRLTVHPENTVAQGLYTKAGFTPTGEMLLTNQSIN